MANTTRPRTTTLRLDHQSQFGRPLDAGQAPTHQQYLGEAESAPIVATISLDPNDLDIPRQLSEAGVEARPAVEQYIWGGSTLDCSIDQSVDLHVPSAELLRPVRWVGHRAEWIHDG